MATINAYLLVGALLFCIGLYGALVKRNIILILMSIELMLNAANINLVAFSNFVAPASIKGQIFAVFVMVVAACEVGIGLALVLLLFRQVRTIFIDKYTELRG